MFTRKHYEAIAAVLAQANLDCDPPNRWVIVGIAARLATLFEEDNPRFSRDTFYAKSAVLEEEPTADVVWMKHWTTPKK